MSNDTTNNATEDHEEESGPSKIQKAWWVYACGPDVRGWKLDKDVFVNRDTQPEFLFYLGDTFGSYVHIFPFEKNGNVIAFGIFQSLESGERVFTEQFKYVCPNKKEFEARFHRFKVYETEWSPLIVSAHSEKENDG